MNTPCSLCRLAILMLFLPAGCSRTSVDSNDIAARQQLTLLMPEAVDIVGPFTRFRSFTDDDRIDGIELLLQPVNTFGDPVNIVGALVVELYEFRQASGESKGAKLEQWDVSLASERDQRTYWNRTTSMYEFQLQFNPATIPPSKKYVLQVTYNTPLQEHMLDEYVLEVPLSAPALGGGGG